jgi:heat shock protein HslJ
MLEPLTSYSHQPRSQPRNLFPLKALVALVGCVAVGSCCGVTSLPPAIAQSTPSTIPRPVPLEGTTWQLAEWRSNGPTVSLLPQRPITIRFDGKRLGGFTGCNSYGVDYQLQDSRLQLRGAVTSTLIACQPEVAEREQQYLTALNSTRINLRNTQNRLTVRYTNASGEGVLTFTPQPTSSQLQSTSWKLSSITSQPTNVGTTQPPVTLQFTADSVQGFAGCNRYRASYQQQQNQLKIGAVISTKKACSPAQMRLEQTFLSALSNIQRYDLDRGNLRLFFRQNNQSGVVLLTPTNSEQ